MITTSIINAAALESYNLYVPPPPEFPLYAWGLNAVYQLGLGDTTARSSPVQVGALTTWSKVSCDNHSLAIKTDGTIWSWGLNTSGQLGLNDFSNRLSPVQVGALTTWSNVDAGLVHTIAIKTDGTLWSWGGNTNGELGLGDTTLRSSPVQVGANTNWTDKISASVNFTLAVTNS